MRRSARHALRRAHVRLAAFALVLGVVFVTALVIGAVVGPLGTG